MNTIRTLIQCLTTFILGLSVTMGLPTTHSNAPTTSTTVNPHLMPNPCGGEIDMDYIPNETDLSESLDELLPNILRINSKVEALKTYMAAKRIQSGMLRSIAEKTASTHYRPEIFPYPTNNFFSDDIFSDLYRNMSMLEIYFSNMAEVEKSHNDDNDAEILGHVTDVTQATQKIRCHLSVIIRFYKESIPIVDFKVDEDKINHSNRSSRYIKHYQIYHMTKVFVESLPDFLSNIL